MAPYFSAVVDQAIADLYYCYDKNRAARAAAALEAAANQGDADAAYLLSRCLSGPEFSWKYHPFVADDTQAARWLGQSIAQGSAMAVLGAMRVGLLNDKLEAAMPFPSIQAAFDAVLAKAEAGCAFAQNMIGNSYYWGDTLRIEGKKPWDFAPDDLQTYRRENLLKCLPWYEKAIAGGMGFAARNLFNLYLEGEKGLIPAMPERAWDVARRCAERGYPEWQLSWSRHLRETAKDDTDMLRQSLEWSQKAVEQGQLDAWFYVGLPYHEGKCVPKDAVYAMHCYEQGMEDPKQVGCRNRAAELLFLGADGVPQDYARAVYLFEQAQALGSDWGSDFLAECYLNGLGCRRDPAHAKELLDRVKWTSERKKHLLGLIYAEGLGVPADIERGVGYWQKNKDYAPSQQALQGYRKNLFGKWVRR